MDQTWYVQWRDNKPFRGGPVTWEIFKKAFHCRFFPRLMRESKVVEFINIHQGGMSVQYSLKFTKSSKYDPPLISDPRDEMSRFVTGLLDDLVKRCRSSMIHDYIKISRIMVHAQQV